MTVRYDWVKDLAKTLPQEQFEQLLPDLLFDIYSECGLDTLLILLDKLPKVPIYVSRVGMRDINLLELRTMTRAKVLKVLPQNLHYIYNMVGIDILVRLLDKFSGIEMYLAPTGLDALRELYIRKHFDGQNTRLLALELGVSQRWVYNVLARRQTPAPQAVSQPRLPLWPGTPPAC